MDSWTVNDSVMEAEGGAEDIAPRRRAQAAWSESMEGTPLRVPIVPGTPVCESTREDTQTAWPGYDEEPSGARSYACSAPDGAYEDPLELYDPEVHYYSNPDDVDEPNYDLRYEH